ncbi:hypothetical protein [Muricoccus aerilatus]|uniref:hypothetical protein n=1 Tax=Muricoccus aerilatus TaxID=452982 RepID=UPI0005C23729|nr:hypothetical protein [Roseomonas aerilata]
MRPQTERQAKRSAPQVETLILLGSDGRHALLGRHAEPDAAELANVATALRAKGLGGWVVRMTGDYWHQRRPVRLQVIKEATPSAVPFVQAAAAFQAIRSGALAS